MTWTHNNKTFESEDIQDNIGFVYLITDLANGMKYIGKKKFISKTKKPPLKGMKRKRTVIEESDWKNYYGSNETLKALVAIDKTRFKREILHLCKSKGEMSYWETKLQFQYDVLLRDDFYNQFVGCKIHKSHLKNLLTSSSKGDTLSGLKQ